MAQTARKQKVEQEECADEKGAHGNFCWNELITHDTAGARKFYADTIGWTFDPMPMQDGGTYWVAKAGDKMVGGIFEATGPEFDGVPEGWLPYLAVDDVDERMKKALAAGAELMRPLFDIPGIGRIAILRTGSGRAAPMRAAKARSQGNVTIALSFCSALTIRSAATSADTWSGFQAVLLADIGEVTYPGQMTVTRTPES